jgi:hypothetical protein
MDYTSKVFQDEMRIEAITDFPGFQQPVCRGARSKTVTNMQRFNNYVLDQPPSHYFWRISCA